MVSLINSLVCLTHQLINFKDKIKREVSAQPKKRGISAMNKQNKKRKEKMKKSISVLYEDSYTQKIIGEEPLLSEKEIR